jgi:hypothetical protein
MWENGIFWLPLKNKWFTGGQSKMGSMKTLVVRGVTAALTVPLAFAMSASAAYAHYNYVYHGKPV